MNDVLWRETAACALEGCCCAGGVHDTGERRYESRVLIFSEAALLEAKNGIEKTYFHEFGTVISTILRIR